MDLLTAALSAAFVISAAWAAISIWLGPALGWVDLPERQGTLSVHDRPAVPLGGVGIYLAIHAGMAMLDRYDVGLAFATGIVLLLGLADDKLDLSPRIRLVVEFLAGVVLITTADVGVEGWWGVVIGTVLVVVAINAVNLFDGLDGLVASTTIVTALGIAWLTDLRGSDGAFGLLLVAAVAGFLVLNWNPAKVFLGDNGAYTVALLLVYGILTSSSSPVSGSRRTSRWWAWASGSLWGFWVFSCSIWR